MDTPTLTPKQKAEVLINKMYGLITDGGDINQVSGDYYKARQCAIVMVKQIINLGVYWIDEQLQQSNPKFYSIDQTSEYWDKVYDELHCKCVAPRIRGYQDMYCLTCSKPIQ